ncbi:hypothetical protein LTR35_000924 [Friedmanniomyces endolithicus]|uniref:Uncharacterized protein n=1 Tax=Friedmanniomyces endolithicus TaxID=329885 RepID=A0AAN6FUA5_9PEZI|nr:hypothetical protein LTS00_011192 [Friedmanniomyces endolithicus]KAK0292893.1 hypothetical protein LTR35_000924 [Friedmanniomyces endolithicus]KAK0323404.1 hypothetical protein LTR82_005764 [Friedmanniomyces endolithicus]KAK1013458.1 hypothetical protein LTR54_004365 [Friedmanniomyces endolithicus]
MTPEDRATFAAAPKSINNDALLDLSIRYTPKEISIHANAGRAKPVISASNVSERLYASINRIAKRDGRIRTEVKGELDAARERASARHSGSIIGAGVLDPATDDDVEMEDAGEEAATGHGLTAGDLLRAIEGPKPLSDAEMEALRRFDETRDYETDNAEDDVEMVVEDDVETAVEVLLAAVESPEPLVYVAPAINQTGSTAPAMAQETVDQSNTGTVAGLEAEAQRLVIDDAEPPGHTATGPRADQGSSPTLSPPTTQADVSDPDSTIAAAGVAALRQRLRALEVNGLFQADELHVMDDEIMKLSVRHSVTEIVEQVNAGTGSTPQYGVKAVQNVVDAAVVSVAARKGQALEAFRAEFEEMRVANGVVAKNGASG